MQWVKQIKLKCISIFVNIINGKNWFTIKTNKPPLKYINSLLIYLYGCIIYFIYSVWFNLSYYKLQYVINFHSYIRNLNFQLEIAYKDVYIHCFGISIIHFYHHLEESRN